VDDLLSFDEQNTIDLELLAKQVVEGFITGLHKSPFHGFSVEFAEHRAYNQGDNIKNIDWKLYARTDKLYRKCYEEETNLRCQMVLDISSSMSFPAKEYNKLRFAVECIAVLTQLLKKQRDAFALSVFEDELLFSTTARSTFAHQKIILNQLEQLLKQNRLNRTTHLATAIHQVAERAHQRSLVLIFSDMLQNGITDQSQDDFFAALQHLKFNRHEVVLFNVTDQKREVNFDFDNRPYQFVDLESGQVLKAHPSQLRVAYQERMKHFRTQLEQRCAQYKIDWVDADISKGFRPILEAYLIKRQRLY